VIGLATFLVATVVRNSIIVVAALGFPRIANSAAFRWISFQLTSTGMSATCFLWNSFNLDLLTSKNRAAQ